MEHQVHIGLRTARVELDISLRVRFDDGPFVARNVVGQFEMGSVHKLKIQLAPVVSPGAELERARLHVEGEVANVDGAGRLEDGLGNPHDITVVRQDTQRVSQPTQACVGAGKQAKGTAS